MSKSHEHDAATKATGPSRDGEIGNSDAGASGATEKVTRGTGEAAPGATHQVKGARRDGEYGNGGGGAPPATDPPVRGGD